MLYGFLARFLTTCTGAPVVPKYAKFNSTNLAFTPPPFRPSHPAKALTIFVLQKSRDHNRPIPATFLPLISAALLPESATQAPQLQLTCQFDLRLRLQKPGFAACQQTRASRCLPPDCSGQEMGSRLL